MKNFKKVLALVLALATLLSFATIAGAKVDTTAIYADADDVKYREAVDVLTAIGVLNGKGASYKPNDTLKRSEAAKIIAMFDNGDTDISSLYNPANTFVDVAKDYWAISYIAYCAKQGIISGVGNNKYAPESKLTGIQFLKMVLVTLGYDAKEEGLVGTSWKVNVLKLARAAGLTDVLGKKYDYDKELTRDAAAQIMLNALNAKTVSYGQEFKTSGKKNILTAAGAIENASYLYESWDLKKVDVKADAFGRPGHTWKLGKEEIDTYVDAPKASYTVAVDGCDIIADCDFDDDGVELTSYTDGVKASKKLAIANNTKNIGGQGVQTLVYEDRIVFINTYLGKVTKVVSEKTDAKGHVVRKAATTVDVYLGDNANQFTAAGDKATVTVETDSFAKDDMVIVTGVVTYNTTTSKNTIDVKTMDVAESKIANFSKIKKVDDGYSQVALDDEFVDIAAKYYFDGIKPADLGKDMVAYYDAYGNLIGMEVYYAPLNYAVIDAIWVETVKGKATIKADLWTIGGEELEDVSVNSIKLTDGTELKAKDVVDAYTAETTGAPSTGTYNWLLFAQSKYAKKNVYDRLMSYTSDDDGVYTLTMKWDSTTPYGEIVGNQAGSNKSSTGPLQKATFSNGSSYVKVKDNSVTPAVDKIKVQMSSETVVLVQDTDTSAPFATYTSYVGYDNVPSMTGDIWYHLDKDTDKADVIYVYNVSVTGTETVIFYKGDIRTSGAEKNDKFPIGFDAYVLDKDTGALTKETFTYKADATDALADAPTGFYTVYVNDKNEITFKGVTAGEDVDTADATTANGPAVATVGDVWTVGSTVIDGEKKVAVYALSDISALDYDKIEAGDELYVYKNTDNGVFTVVDAVDTATILFTNAAGTETYTGKATEQVIGHKWEAMTITGIPANMEVTAVKQGADKAAALAATTPIADYDKDSTTLVVDKYIVVVLDYVASYHQYEINDVSNITAATIDTATKKITLNVNYKLADLQTALEAAAPKGAKVEIFRAEGALADTDWVAGTTGWFVRVTAACGEVPTATSTTNHSAIYTLK